MLKCEHCPFETPNRAKMLHHKQFHRPRGLPFRCPHCSYNVTRRHLLDQHMLIHGPSPGGSESLASSLPSSITVETRKSPSPSLTITPVSANGAGAVPAASSIDSARLPLLSDDLTKNLPEIPLVWVSRENRYFKMFKCRHCPHVNLRKTNIQEHEKMHRPEGLTPGTGHACPACTYVCINAGVMSAHAKVHSGSMGKCHAIVDPALPNEEQLKMLATPLPPPPKPVEDKCLYYCQSCPARFFLTKEVQIHSRFHSMNFPVSCSKCSFRAREESQVLAHAKVHTTEYQERTRTLMAVHPSARDFPPVPGVSVSGDQPTFGVKESENSNSSNSGLSRPWLASSPSIPTPPPTTRFKCDLCPSTFTKQITLQYHQSLHGCDNPYKCNRCNYAAKTQDGLTQHSALHDKEQEKSCTPSPAPSPSPQKMLENALNKSLVAGETQTTSSSSLDQPPIKMKLISLKTDNNGTSSKHFKKNQFKYYIEEQVPLSGIDLLRRKTQMEQELPKDEAQLLMNNRASILQLQAKQAASQESQTKERIGNPSLNYPLHIDKATGRTREKRYKCMKCPSAFDKMDQFNVHINLHGTNGRYKCKLCDYSVKFIANFGMHIKRHKYHEHIEAQNKGLPQPRDDDLKYEPIIGPKDLSGSGPES